MAEQLSSLISQKAVDAFQVALLRPIMAKIPEMGADQFAQHAWDTLHQLRTGAVTDNEALQVAQQLLGNNDISVKCLLLKERIPSLADVIAQKVRPGDGTFGRRVADNIRFLEISVNVPSMRNLLRR